MTFERASGDRVEAKFGASGLLKDEIVGGARAGVFASANMERPQALARANRSGPVVLFARNQLCALVRPGLAVGTATLLDRMLAKEVKLGTSTPQADSSGDQAWEVFRKADKIKPGACAVLDKKALQLTGGPSRPAPPSGRTIYGTLVAQGAADIFLTYCTNALAAQKENSGQQIVALPEALAVGVDYGLTVMVDASPAAYRFALFILSAEGQRVLLNYGFTASNLPQQCSYPIRHCLERDRLFSVALARPDGLPALFERAGFGGIERTSLTIRMNYAHLPDFGV